jgi:hypothetical protein
MTSGVCRLCGKIGELQRSHLLPRGLYAQLRADGSLNPNPLNIGNGRMIQSSQQMTAHLLCRLCEQRFSSRGECWMLNHCFQSKSGRFALYADLINQPELLRVRDDVYYAGSQLSGVASLVYFAMSVFWRAAAHRWKLREEECHIELGPYTEAIGLFLLDRGPVPGHTALITLLAPLDNARPIAHFPKQSGGAADGCRTFEFLIPGVNFVLFTGKRIPQDFMKMCTASSPERVIGVSNKIVEDECSRVMRSGMPK